MQTLTNEDAINQDFIDPIYMTIMKNPVVLSSGVVVDLTTASKFNDKNRIQFDKCPFTNQKLKPKAFPLNCLKSEIVEFTKQRFNTSISIAKQFKDQPEKFNRAIDAAETFLKDLGEDTYKF